MKRRVRPIVLLIVGLGAGLTACTPAGDLAFCNEGPDNVRVSTGNQEFTIDADGGVQILGYGCTEEDIRVEFTSGQELTITERVCPDQQIVIQDGTVDLRPAPAT